MSKENTIGNPEHVLSYVREVFLKYPLITPGERVLIGISGGVDSMVLTHCLLQISKEIGFEIGCAHLHHGLRGKDADDDLIFVSDYCDNNDLPFFSQRVDIQAIAAEKHISIENAGRKTRYAFFNDVMRIHYYDKLALAHHADDQAETIIMRLARGTGIKGVSGMRISDEKVIRPLLGVSRRAIEAFAKVRGIAFRQDVTNDDVTFSRNYIRHEVMPRLESKYFGAGMHIAAFAEDAALYEAFFQKEVARRNALFSVIDGHFGFPVKELMAEEVLMRSALIRRLIEKGADLTDVRRIHVEKILSILNKGKTTWTLNLPRGIIVERRYNWLICYRNKEQTMNPYLASQTFCPQKNVLFVDASGKQALTVLFKHQSPSKNNIICKNNDEIILGYGKIKHNMVIRHPMPGDRITLSDGKHQKLKDFFINRKISSSLRKRLFIISEGETILWIPGLFHYINWDSMKNSEKTICIKWEHIDDRRN